MLQWHSYNSNVTMALLQILHKEWHCYNCSTTLALLQLLCYSGIITISVLHGQCYTFSVTVELLQVQCYIADVILCKYSYISLSQWVIHMLVCVSVYKGVCFCHYKTDLTATADCVMFWQGPTVCMCVRVSVCVSHC